MIVPNLFNEIPIWSTCLYETINGKANVLLGTPAVPAKQIRYKNKSPVSLELAVARGFFTTKEAAAYLSVSPGTVLNLKAKGLLKTVSGTSAGRRMITIDSLNKYIGVKK